METTPQAFPAWKETARHGAGVGARMTILYASLFLLYALVRSSFELSAMPAPESGTAGTLLATVISLTVATAAIALLLIPLSALVGMGTSLLLRRLLPEIGVAKSLGGTFIISLVVAFAVADTVQFILLPALGFEPLELPFGTWLFWFGIPSVIYIITIGLEGAWLRSRRLLRGPFPPVRGDVSDQWR